MKIIRITSAVVLQQVVHNCSVNDLLTTSY